MPLRSSCGKSRGGNDDRGSKPATAVRILDFTDPAPSESAGWPIDKSFWIRLRCAVIRKWNWSADLTRNALSGNGRQAAECAVRAYRRVDHIDLLNTIVDLNEMTAVGLA